jgi:uncharacterized membrane protein YfcA
VRRRADVRRAADVCGTAETDVILAVVLGVAVGFVLGLLGGGGSILAVPALRYGLGLDEKASIASALVVVGAAAVAGAVTHARRGTLDLRVALGFGLLGAAGSFAGARVARLLTGPEQLGLFTVVVLVVAGLMLRPRRSGGTPEATTPGPGPVRPFRVAAAALGAGLLTGLVGVGGGFVIVPALTLVVGLPMDRAIGTSLAVIALNALGGLVGYAADVRVAEPAILLFAAAAVLASTAGATIAPRIGAARLRRAFAILLLLVAAGMVAREARGFFGSR